jgi:hypothetical protein
VRPFDERARLPLDVERVSYDLGRYVCICFIPNEDGIPHYELDPGVLASST